MLPAVQSLTPHERRRERMAVVILLTLALTLTLLLVHASWSRVQRAEAAGAWPVWVRALPSTALVLSTRSRWLRHPYLSEPGAAFQDGPAFLDADPAGALQSPPAGLFSRSEAR